MDNLEIRRMKTSEAKHLAYITSLAFWNHPMLKAVFQTKDEKLRNIVERDFHGLFENAPHETFVAELNGKVLGCIRSGSCKGNWHRGFSNSEEDYQHYINCKIEDLSILQREKWLWGTCEIHDIDIPHSHVGPIVVIPEFQGRGVGSLLMDDYFARLGGGVSFLETFSESNVRFYGNRGYRVMAADVILGIKGYWMIRE